mmetsp:Transcript_51949/g.137203  ORF Transcript_51949/g.137203 Transcript_51949/m.137203 type:complete len:142 (-) Transcript_51949:151-576(-)
MQRVLGSLFVLLAALPTAHCSCNQADQERAATAACFNALVAPNTTQLTPCVDTSYNFNGTCTSLICCPYLRSWAACFPGECCTSDIESLVNDKRETFNTSYNAQCERLACGMALVGGASGSAVSAALPAAAFLAALLAWRQ